MPKGKNTVAVHDLRIDLEMMNRLRLQAIQESKDQGVPITIGTLINRALDRSYQINKMVEDSIKNGKERVAKIYNTLEEAKNMPFGTFTVTESEILDLSFKSTSLNEIAKKMNKLHKNDRFNGKRFTGSIIDNALCRIMKKVKDSKE